MRKIFDWFGDVIKNEKKHHIPFTDTKYKIKYAFTCKGIEFFEFDDVFNLPYKRGLTAITFYEESRMKVNLEYLKAHCTAQDNIFMSNKVDVYKLKALNDQLKERLDIIVDVDQLYKLASVVFFRKGENPALYEPKAAQANIDHWKKHASMQDFFLQEPLTRLIPFLKESIGNLKTYQKAVAKINEQHWEVLSSQLSEEQMKSFSTNND